MGSMCFSLASRFHSVSLHALTYQSARAAYEMLPGGSVYSLLLPSREMNSLFSKHYSWSWKYWGRGACGWAL